MTMNRTDGYIKAFVDVYYVNNAGVKHHMMSFQLATGLINNGGDYDRVCQTKEKCERDHSQMQEYIRAAIATVEANDYQLTLEFGLCC